MLREVSVNIEDPGRTIRRRKHVPEIIERAERLRQQALTSRERAIEVRQGYKMVGRDLSIPDQFVEQAIRDMRTERREQKEAAQQALEERELSRRSSGVSMLLRLGGVVMGLIVLVRSVQWLWFALDFTPSIAYRT